MKNRSFRSTGQKRVEALRATVKFLTVTVEAQELLLHRTFVRGIGTNQARELELDRQSNSRHSKIGYGADIPPSQSLRRGATADIPHKVTKEGH